MTRPVEWYRLKSPAPCRGGYHPPARAALFGTAPVEWYQPQAAAKTFPWGKVPRLAGAKEGGGMQDIPGEMVRCTDSPRNVRKTVANRRPLQSCFASQIINIGIIATGNDCYLRFAARRTAPREAFVSHITFCHSTYPVCYPTWVGRIISSPTGPEFYFIPFNGLHSVFGMSPPLISHTRWV